MPRTRTPTVVSIILAFGALSIGVRQVQSPPVPLSDEKLKPRSVGCAPYTRWDPSGETCVSCSPEDCLPGEELREDCGYNEEGYPVANSCRTCPNGTYSATGGQKQCQACKTCSSGYEQECNPKQPAVCLCADDEELSPDGTTCQKICCLCWSDPNPSDIINECFQRYPGTDYHCKNSWSTGNTCTRPPEPTTTTVSPTTTPQQTTVRNTSTGIPTPDTTHSSEAPPTFPVSSTPSNSPSEPTTNHTGTSKPLPIHKGKEGLPWHVFVIAGTCIAGVLGIICCWKREKIAAHLFKTNGFDRLIGAESDGEEGDYGGAGVVYGGGHYRGAGVPVVYGGGEYGGHPEGQDEEVNNSDGADSGNVSNESSDAGSDKRDSQCSSKDSLLDSEGGQEEEGTQEGESTDSGDRETLDNENEKTVPKEVESEETMGFAGRIEGPPNDGKGLEAVPTGGGPNRPNQQQPGGQNGQPAVNISGGTFNGPVTIVVQGNNSHYNAGQGMDGQGQGTPGNGNGRVGNRRRQNIRVNILPNPARLGQNVRFSCTLPDNLDPGTCEFRWTKQVDCVAHVQNWNRAVQHCDVGVYTCEVTTSGGEVLDGQAELVIIEDDAAGGVDLPGPSRRPRDNDSDGHNTPRKRPRTAGPGTSGAQGFSSGQIQGIHQLPLEAILNEEDLLYNLRIKLEQSDRHYRNIGSHFGLTHEELGFIEFTELGGKDSPLRAILQKVIQNNANRTVGELLQYCDETLKRRDVVKTVVEYFVEKEQKNQEVDMEVKESVVEDNLQQTEKCCKKDNVDSEMKEVGSQSAAMDVPEESLSDSESSVAHKKLGTCDFNTEAIELVKIPS
ncbi:PREDICTED: uncharacterized protein LOC109487622 [Branchiostoma belcheri]|uniref:Uncharacterized protein LOC109487622 n=1 Tax=Branchiostoma belcheri TaxID=7741 RepID=A0A6P5AYJ0_BRABE|nr:PREDICTED: uncharacterized protein LOC109487622 [Branchiostoma belcheri]